MTCCNFFISLSEMTTETAGATIIATILRVPRLRPARRHRSPGLLRWDRGHRCRQMRTTFLSFLFTFLNDLLSAHSFFPLTRIGLSTGFDASRNASWTSASGWVSSGNAARHASSGDARVAADAWSSASELHASPGNAAAGNAGRTAGDWRRSSASIHA